MVANTIEAAIVKVVAFVLTTKDITTNDLFMLIIQVIKSGQNPSG